MKKYIKSASLAVLALVITGVTLPMSVSAANTMPIEFQAWNSETLCNGSFDNTRLTQSMGRMAITLQYGRQSGTWTSPTYKTDKPFNKAVTSWQASTPGESHIETQLQVQRQDGQWSKWYNMGNWALRIPLTAMAT